MVITTVGPYVRYGEPLVAACAAAGTDYADLTGEPEFVDRMYFQSALTGLGRLRQNVAAHRARTAAERAAAAATPTPPARRIRGLPARPRREAAIDAWAIPLPTIDAAIVLRSARALERYGPDFRYGHFAWVEHLPVAVGAAAGLTGVVALAQLPPARRLLHKALAAGTGPSPQRRAKSSFAVRFTGEGGGQRVLCEVSGGDPGYDETAKMLAETGLALAFDPAPPTAGQVTTAQALGAPLRERLVRAGMAFRVLDARSAIATAR